MTERLRSAVSTGRATVRLAQEAQLSLLAAAIAYYAFVSAVPLVVLAVLIATTIGGADLADRVVAGAEGVLEPEGESLLRGAVTARTGAGSVTAAGLVVLLWGALKAFRALDGAFAVVYGTPTAPSFAASVRNGAVALVAVGGGVALTFAVGTAVAFFAGGVGGAVGTVVLIPTLIVVLLPLYYLFPDVDVSVREVLPGAALVAVGWTVLGSAFNVYATTIGGASLYGLLGAVLLALTWLYLGALLLLVGAAVNAVQAGHDRAAGGIGTYNAPAEQGSEE